MSESDNKNQSPYLRAMIESAMRRCIELAKEAASKGQYPLGAVVVRDNVILGECGSFLLSGNDPTAHPEIVAIRQAAQKLQSRYIEGAYLVTTLEPCPMCASAAVWAKMEGIAFGTSQKTAADWGVKKNDPEFSFRQINIECKDVVARGTPSLRILPGVFMDECDALLTLAGRK